MHAKTSFVQALQLKQKPYNLLLVTAILLFIVGLFGFDTAIDIHLHDTYFIVPFSYYIWLLAAIPAIFWLVYLATKSILFSSALSWTHIVLTIAYCVFTLTLPYFIENYNKRFAGMPRRYYDFGQSKVYNASLFLSKGTLILIFILAIGQLAYLINFSIGLYKRINGKKPADF